MTILAPLTAMCLSAVASAFAVPEHALVAILAVEAGQVGQCSRNTNGTVDCGPFQINSIWYKRFADKWNVDEQTAARQIRDHGCWNAVAAGNILSLYLQESQGDLRLALGYYHSHTEGLRERYTTKVEHAYRRLYGATPWKSRGPE